MGLAFFRRERRQRPGGFLRRLARSRGGNTLAMMAIALIPLCALAGSAVDTARMYVVKVRLQQACDAGVLAGRKFMADDSNAALDANAKTQADTFFANNIKSGWLGTKNLSFTPKKTADKQVSGEAQTTIPMTIMKMFGQGDVTMKVTCEARFDVADADVMFVLDTTGSMSCEPSAAATCSGASYSYKRADGSTGFAATEDSDSKIQALREAVVDFDSTMRSNADPSTHIRYGFVTYTSQVNVGDALRKLPVNYLVSDDWNFNTRTLQGEQQSSNGSTTLSGYNSSNCSSANGRYPGTNITDRSGWYTNSTAYYISGASWSSGACKANYRIMAPIWRYRKTTLDVSQYVTGNATLDPTRLDGRTSKWRGCIEYPDTTATATFDIDNLPADLDPDRIPSSDAERFRPLWPEATWMRNTLGAEDSAQSDADRENDSNGRPYGIDYMQSRGLAPCGMPASRLKEMTASEVYNYVNNVDFKPLGGTYHDLGMIWGTRMLSPNGIFKDDTKAWAGRNEPARHIVFMTDGQMAPTTTALSAYGIEVYDQRVTAGDFDEQTNLHNARFLAECDYAKNRLNMTVWVVALGTTLTSNLQSCASPGTHAFTASSKKELQDAFKTIAKQVAMLRVSK